MSKFDKHGVPIGPRFKTNQRVDNFRGSPQVKHTIWAGTEKPWAAYKGRIQLVSAECAYLYDVGKNLGSGNYANLGTFRGGSAACIAHGLRHSKSDGKIYCVDLWRGPGSKGTDLEEMQRNFQADDIDKYAIYCKGFIHEWSEKLKDLEFNFVFLDGEHSYENAERDFNAWFPLIKRGGVIAFHDCHFLSIDTFLKEQVETRTDLEELEGYYRIRQFRKIK